jgi:hypothetical protein
MFPSHDSHAARGVAGPPAGGSESVASSGQISAIVSGSPAAESRWHVVGNLPIAYPPAIAQPQAMSYSTGMPAGGPYLSGPYQPPGSFGYPYGACVPPPIADPVEQTASLPAAPAAPHVARPIVGGQSATAAAPTASTPAAPIVTLRPRSRLGEMPSWLISVVVHLVALILLAAVPMWWREVTAMMPTSLVLEESEVTSDIEAKEPQVEDVDLTSLDVTEAKIIDAAESGDVLDGVGLENDTSSAESEVLMPAEEVDSLVKAAAGPFSKLAEEGDLAGRGAATRGDLVRSGGGTAASEEAVARALRWIVAHQAEDGGWNFDHRRGSGCDNRCGNHGNAANARSGATAMALLPLLGAGNTHQDGRYKENVNRGLRFLCLRQDKATGSFHEPQGDMYSHGLAAIALCESYAMTKDRALQKHAQGAIDFISTAQDPVGGGWRYAPRQPGDTSVVGWQMMALKSGLMGYLDVQPDTIRLAGRFLDHVQDGGGSQYGYTDSGGEPATTWIGLLCRMYMGWRHEYPPLKRGVEYLRKTGPSDTNMYYNYYATQVIHHYGGDAWKEWNGEMRDWLIKRQLKEGHSAGSWFMRDNFVGQGGRLYCTALSAMILEVYYRHLSIYRKESLTEKFATSK